MSKIINGGLDQYGAEPFEQQQFGTAGVKGVNMLNNKVLLYAAVVIIAMFVASSIHTEM